MTTLIILTLVWAAVLVLALVVYLSATAFYLRRAKSHVAGIANDLEAVDRYTQPLSELLSSVDGHLSAVHEDFQKVESGFGQVLDAVSGSVPSEGE